MQVGTGHDAVMTIITAWFYRTGTRLLQTAVVLLVAFLFCPFGWTGKIYTFRDDQGNYLFTNMVNQAQQPQGSAFQEYRHLEKITYYKDSNIHSYHNWGGNEDAVLASFSKNRHRWDPIIRRVAQQEGIDSGLVKAVMHTESGFNPAARSLPGAEGLMQLMPATARLYHVSDPYDPVQNIRAGVHHLAYLIHKFGDISLALAAYNAGIKNVIKYGGIPPFSETQDYVRRVLSRYHHLYAAGV